MTTARRRPRPPHPRRTNRQPGAAGEVDGHTWTARRARWAITLWCALCTGATAALLRAGSTALPAELLDVTAWRRWTEVHGATELVLAVGRLVALALLVVAAGATAVVGGHTVWAVRRGRDVHRWVAASLLVSLITSVATSGTAVGASTDAGAGTLSGADERPTVELVDGTGTDDAADRMAVRGGGTSGARPAPGATSATSAPLPSAPQVGSRATAAPPRPARPSRTAGAGRPVTPRQTRTTSTRPRPGRSAPSSTTPAMGAVAPSSATPRTGRVTPAGPGSATPGPSRAGRPGPAAEPAPPADRQGSRSAVPPPTSVPPPAAGTATARPASPASATTQATTVTVRAGDSMWTIAERTVAARTGTAPSDAATAAYWLQLIEANRDRLVSPDDPGTIFPGQVLTLP